MFANNNKPILVTGAGGRMGGVSTFVVEMLRKEGLAVRATVRREDERAEMLRKLGAEVVVADLTLVEDLNRVMAGCSKVFFSLPVSAAYLQGSLSAIAVAKHQGIDVFVNMSQLTASLMSINKTVASPQAKAHWLVEQALEWSRLPYVNIQPTILLENPFFLHWPKETIKQFNELRIPFADTRVNPIAAYDVARVIVTVLKNPALHIGKSYPLVGPVLEDMKEVAKEYSTALGREIKYIPMNVDEFRDTTIKQSKETGFLDEHAAKHEYELAKLLQTKERQVDNDNVKRITGIPSMKITEWVRGHAQDFKKASQVM